MKVPSIILLTICIIIPLFVGAIGSFFTLPSIASWYVTLHKPFFTPPNWIFGPVWTILYVMMGISLWLIIKNGSNGTMIRQGIMFFTAQLGVNLCWSLVFFGLQSPVGGFGIICLLIVLIGGTIKYFMKISKPAAYLLIPYLCWTCFATILNGAVIILN